MAIFGPLLVVQKKPFFDRLNLIASKEYMLSEQAFYEPIRKDPRCYPSLPSGLRPASNDLPVFLDLKPLTFGVSPSLSSCLTIRLLIFRPAMSEIAWVGLRKRQLSSVPPSSLAALGCARVLNGLGRSPRIGSNLCELRRCGERPRGNARTRCLHAF